MNRQHLVGFSVLVTLVFSVLLPRATFALPQRVTAPQALIDHPIVPQIDTAMKARLRQILADGAAQGNRSAVFAKIGDSITESGSFLQDVGCGMEQAALGEHSELTAIIDYFSATTLPSNYSNAWCGVANSFTRASASATAGWTADRALAPTQNSQCNSDESALQCELRLLKPAIALIMYGTNDLQTHNDLERYRSELTQIITETIAAGVIPVISTIPPRFDSDALAARVAPHNQVVVDVALANQVPIWNYWRALQAASMINQGISDDLVHPNLFNGNEAANFTSEALRYGYNQRNFGALQVLAKLKTVVIDNGAADSSGDSPTATPDAGNSAENTPTATSSPTTGCATEKRSWWQIFGGGCRVHLPLITKAAVDAPTNTPEPATSTPTSPPATSTPIETPAPTPTTAVSGCIVIPPGAVTLVTLGDSLTEGDGDDGNGGFPARLIADIQTLRTGSTLTNVGKSGWGSDALISGDQGLPSQLTQAVELLNQAREQGRVGIATLWIGSNDLWYLYDGDSATPDEDESADGQRYSNNLHQIIGDLRATGATIYVALLDDQSKRPVATQGQAFPGISGSELALMSAQVDRYNDAVRARASQHGAGVVDFFNTTLFTTAATLADDGNHPNSAGYDQIADIWFTALQPGLNGCVSSLGDTGLNDRSDN